VGNVTETAHFGIWVTIDCLDDVCTEKVSNENGDKGPEFVKKYHGY
jgi:hypothetical protein